MQSFADIMQHVDRYFSAPLFSPDAWDSLLKIGAQLPISLADGVGFECRMAADHGQVDLISLHYVEHALPLATHAAQFTEHIAWQRVRELAQTWHDSSTAIHQAIDVIWLEFDALPDRLHIPSIYVAPQRDRRQAFVTAPTVEVDLVDELTTLTTGEPLPSALRANLERCLAAMPPGTGLYFAGWMIARQADFFRIVVGRVQLRDLPDLFARLDWGGDTDAVMAHIERFGPFAKDMLLYFDLTSTLLPRVGWEISLSLYNRHTVDEAQPLLEHLVAMGLCVPSKAKAISEWVGGNHMKLADKASAGVLLRAVNHLKFVYVPDQALTAKVYLAMGYRDRF